MTTVRPRAFVLGPWVVLAALCLAVSVPRLVDGDVGEPSTPVATVVCVLGLAIGARVLVIRVSVGERVEVVNLLRGWDVAVEDIRRIELGGTRAVVAGWRFGPAPLLVLVLDDRQLPIYATAHGHLEELFALVDRLPDVPADVDWSVFS